MRIMDDFMIVRIALDNVHPPQIGLKAMDAFDRIVDGRAVGDTESRTGLGTRAQEPRLDPQSSQDPFRQQAGG